MDDDDFDYGPSGGEESDPLGDEGLDDDIDMGFADVPTEKERRKAYEVEFAVHSRAELEAQYRADCTQVAEVLGVQEREALNLLQSLRWKKDKLLEAYMDNHESILEKAGVRLGYTGPEKKVLPGFVCDICCESELNMATVALSCGHRYCAECYQQYLTSKISEGESHIECMETKCTVCVDEPFVKACVPPETFAKYQRNICQSFVGQNDYLRWCPAPNCDNIVECHVLNSQLPTVVPTVTCRCGNPFCFGCGERDHLPAPCHIVKMWLKKCADDSETANWISVNTKECPKCHTTIEKNGGCNHMTCKAFTCKYEFCWVCQGPWSDHGSSYYSCNRFDEKSSAEARGAQAKSRMSLERYLHYYTRYQNHDNSAKLDQELYSRIEAKMARMQAQTELSWIEVQFLKRAADVLFQCRMTLKWTYAFAFYLKKDNQTEIFECNQRDLELAVEQLSAYLESNFEPAQIPTLRQAILDKTGYVSQRREILLADTASGLVEGRWQFSLSSSGSPSSN